jgi:thiol-disulfide isomerase/thioredoxin
LDNSPANRIKGLSTNFVLCELFILGAKSMFYGLIFSTLLGGCADANRVKELEEKLAQLETKVDELEKKGVSAKPAAGAAKADAANDAEENEARKLFSELTSLLQKGEMAEAKKTAKTMESKYSNTKTWRRARKIVAELEVIGKPAPAKLEIEKWYQGEGTVTLNSSKPTLLVFWEIWCPHCKREVPELQATFDKYNAKGLQMVGLTKQTRNKTDDEIQQFIDSKKVAYPIAKENGSLSQAFSVSGIPAAAVVKDGKIVWRGHPARLSDAMIEGWL